MKTALWILAEVVFCVVAVVVVAGWMVEKYGEPIRAAIYIGSAAGGVLALVGLPSTLILARVGRQRGDDSRFWKWWGSGLLMRMAVFALLSQNLERFSGSQFRTAASMAMISIYLVGLFSEVGWLASILTKTDVKKA